MYCTHLAQESFRYSTPAQCMRVLGEKWRWGIAWGQGIVEHRSGAKREGKGVLKRLASEPGLLLEWLGVSSNATRPTLYPLLVLSVR